MYLEVFLNKKLYITFTELCPTARKKKQINPKLNRQQYTRLYKRAEHHKVMEIDTCLMDKAIMISLQLCLEHVLCHANKPQQ